MEMLRKKCLKICDVNGIMTYILSPDALSDILNDHELLSALSISKVSEKFVAHYINYAVSNPSQIFFAFAHFGNRKDSFSWMPVNCFKHGDSYYHIAIRSTWVCRACGHVHHGTFIMPISEHEPIFYSGTDNKFPDIPPVFTKLTCENCGAILQNHFIPINNIDQI